MLARRDDNSLDSSILLEPPSLLFPPPHHDRAVQNVLVLYNMSAAPCVFKVKSQTPGRYYTKPTIGAISTNGAVRVRIILRPQCEDVPPATRDLFRFCFKHIPAKWLNKNAGSLHEMKLLDLWCDLGGEEAITVKRDVPCAFRSGGDLPSGAFISVLDPASPSLHDARSHATTVSFSRAGIGANSGVKHTDEAVKSGKRLFGGTLEEQIKNMRYSIDCGEGGGVDVAKMFRGKSKGLEVNPSSSSFSSFAAKHPFVCRERRSELTLRLRNRYKKRSEKEGYHGALLVFIMSILIAGGLYIGWKMNSGGGSGGGVGGELLLFFSYIKKIMDGVDMYITTLISAIENNLIKIMPVLNHSKLTI